MNSALCRVVGCVGLPTAAVCLLTAAACDAPQQGREVDAWMVCDECGDQRERVARVGREAVPELARILVSPSPGLIELARLQIVASYDTVTAMRDSQYVALMLDAYVARSQVRAATSLGDIGTEDARVELGRALDQAESRRYRRDVKRAIEGALARATHSTFTGSIAPANVDFGQIVRVREGDIPWDGNESVELHGSPFGTELLVQPATSGGADSLGFIAVGELGTYTLSVKGLGTADRTQIDTITIRSIRYQVSDQSNADTITESDFPSASAPYTKYLVLGSVRADTVDYLKVMPTTDVTVTATARWPGLRSVHLAWRGCASGISGTSVSGKIVSDKGAPVGGARVYFADPAGNAVSAMTDPTGTFQLQIGGRGGGPIGLVALRVGRIGYSPRTFMVPRGTTGNTLTLPRADATPATAISMASSVTSISGGGCAIVQVWMAPGRHQIVQLKIQ